MRVPAFEIYFTFSRSGGPGGQNVNKVNSKATLHWFPAASAIDPAIKSRFQARYATHLTQSGEFTTNSNRYRDQHRNVQDCLEKLEELLETVARPPKRRRPTKPTGGSRERRLQSKKLQARKKSGRRVAPEEF